MTDFNPPPIVPTVTRITTVPDAERCLVCGSSMTRDYVGEFDCDACVCHFHAHHLERARRTADARVTEAVRGLKRVIERDRSAVAAGVSGLLEVLKGYDWLTEGRGPFVCNDDQWHKEIAAAAVAIREAVKSLQKIGADLSDSPTDPEEIALARRTADARVAEVEKPWREALEFIVTGYPCISELVGRPVGEDDMPCTCARCYAEIKLRALLAAAQGGA